MAALTAAAAFLVRRTGATEVRFGAAVRALMRGTGGLFVTPAATGETSHKGGWVGEVGV